MRSLTVLGLPLALATACSQQATPETPSGTATRALTGVAESGTLQLLAVNTEGESFDVAPAADGAFRLALPTPLPVHLFVIREDMIQVVKFAETIGGEKTISTIPNGSGEAGMGQLQTAQDDPVVSEAAETPLEDIDSDGDGTADAEDSDDDNDGINDAEDTDDDGVPGPDSDDDLDADSDGHPDLCDDDDDNDGVSDDDDLDNVGDADSDGVHDDDDRDDDNDGDTDGSDDDDDDDGVLDDDDGNEEADADSAEGDGDDETDDGEGEGETDDGEGEDASA